MNTVVIDGPEQLAELKAAAFDQYRTVLADLQLLAAIPSLIAEIELLKLDVESRNDMIRHLLPLASGYVAANPGIRSTECIIEDAQAMVMEDIL